MEIKILSVDFKIVRVLDSAIYLSYTECFKRAGDFKMRVPFSTELYKSLLPPARILVENLIFNVEMIEVENGVISVTGLGIFDEFSHMSITSPFLGVATPCSTIARLASTASFEGTSYVYYGLTEVSSEVIKRLDWCSDYASVITGIFEDYNLGYRMIYNDQTNELEFHLRQNIDKVYNAEERVIISDQTQDYELLKATLDIRNYKNRVEVAQWYIAHAHLYTQAYDRSDGERVRQISVPAQIPAENEEQLFAGFKTIADRTFQEYSAKEIYRVRILKDKGIRVGDICALECLALDFGKGAVVASREVKYENGTREEILIMEIDK